MTALLTHQTHTDAAVMDPKRRNRAKAIGERLRKLREAKDLSQSQLAKLIGTSQPNIDRWESGTEIPGSMMIPLATALETTCEAIVGPAPPPPPRGKPKRDD